MLEFSYITVYLTRYRWLVAGQSRTTVCFPAVKPGLILMKEAELSTNLNELNARKPLVGPISQTSEEPRQKSLVAIIV
jgi:hypothetical protein